LKVFKSKEKEEMIKESIIQKKGTAFLNRKLKFSY